MKVKITLILAFLFIFSMNMNAQEDRAADIQDANGQKFDFQTNGWKKTVQAAKVEKKYIFIQFVTNDCPPCEQLKEEVWTNAKLASIYSKSFLLFSPEEGSKDAKNLISKYRINSYPTSIFVDASGKIIHKYIGYTSKDVMTEMAENVKNSINTLQYLDKLYKKEGKRMDPNSLYIYANVLMNAGRDYEKVAKEYLATQSDDDLHSEHNLVAMMLFTNDMYSREFGFLVKHKDEFEGEKVTNNQITMKIEDVISNSLISAMEASKKVVLKDTLSKTIIFFEIRDPYLIQTRVEMDYYDYIGTDKDIYFQSLDRYMQLHIRYLSAATISDKVNRIIMENDNKEILSNAIMWVNEAVMEDMMENEELIIAYIRLLVKDGRYQEANDMAESLKQLWIQKGLSEEESSLKYDMLMNDIDEGIKRNSESDDGVVVPNR